MKTLKITILFIFLTSICFSQTPIFSFNDSKFNENFSRISMIDGKAYINFNEEFHDYNKNLHICKSHQIIMNQNADIEKSIIIDSIDYPEFGVQLPILIKKDSFLYQFGGLYGNSATKFRFLIRKNDKNLNLISDSVYNLNNGIISVSDAIIDSNTMLICGSMYNIVSSESKGFIFRIDNSKQIIDSSIFTLPSSSLFNFAFIAFGDTSLQLKISSSYFNEDAVYRISRSLLSITDTLYSTFPTQSKYYTPNAFVNINSDSSYLSTVSGFKTEFQLDSTNSIIGWISWDINSIPIDTIYPFKDTLISDFVGDFNSMIIYNNDSLILGYNHNDWYFSPPWDSNSVGVLFSDLMGNVSKTVYLGHDGLNYNFENISRFDNGNLVVIARVKDWDTTAINQTSDLIIWMLDSVGNIIQEIEYPLQKKLKLLVFPNPTSDKININLNSDSQIIEAIRLFNVNGQELLSQIINNTSFSIDLSSFPSGLYVLVGETNTGEMFRKKFVKE